MIPDAYCAERVRAAGGDLDLIVRFAPAARRAAMCALAALRAELEHLVEQHHDPAVAAAKLAWWRDELAAFASGDAHHPATRALLAADHDRAALATAMLAFSAGLDAELAGRCVLEPAAWQALLAARGRWAQALTAVATTATPLAAAALDALGRALAELELLATLGRRLGNARPALDSGWGITQGAFVAAADDALGVVATRAEVEGEDRGARSAAPLRGPRNGERFDRVVGLFELGLGAAEQHHGRAAPRALDRHGLADAVAGAGHEDHAVLQRIGRQRRVRGDGVGHRVVLRWLRARRARR